MGEAALRIDTPRWALPLLEPARYKGAYGGRGCVHKDTLIDTPAGQVKISDFKGGEVYSYHNGKIVTAMATAAQEYSEEQLYEVSFANGARIVATDQHKFLTAEGWKELSSLGCGDGVTLLPQKSWPSPLRTKGGNARSKWMPSVRRSIQTAADSLENCFLYLHQYGLRPQMVTDTGLFFAPSPAYAEPHSCRVLSREDETGRGSRCIPSSSCTHASSHGVPPAEALQYCEGMGNYTGGKSSAQPSAFSQSRRLFPCCTSPEKPFSKPEELRQGSGNRKGWGKSLQRLCGKLRNVSVGMSVARPCANLHSEGGGFIISRVAFVRKHSRQKYWDLHVFGTHNYLSNGIVNHNSGKSHFFAECLIERHIMYPGTSSVCVREVQKSLNQSVKRLLELKIEELGVGDYFEVQEAVIKSKGGGLIIFQGMQNHTADSIKSLENYDVAWVEEAQSLSQRSLDLLRPTIRKEGSELWFSWNPNSADDPVDMLLRGTNPPPGAVVIEVNYMDNPWFPDVLTCEMEYDKRRDPDKYAHIWLGAYQRHSTARVFRNWKVEEFTAPADAVHRLGGDWGFANDPTVLVRCHTIGKTLYVDHEAYMVGCEIVDTPALFLTIPDAEKWPIIADSARPETISYMQKNGFPKIFPAVKGAKSIEEGVEWLKSFDIVVHPRCQHTIDELSLYSYKVDPHTSAILPILDDKDNHVIDALRYACEGARRIQATRRVVPQRYRAFDNEVGL